MMWLLRFAALVAAFVLLRHVARWVWRNVLSPGPHAQVPPARQGVMKRDPACGTYVDVEVSVQARAGDEVLHFCSTQCRDVYLAQHAAAAKAP
ncbi:MAG TPA: hypothetical protein VNN18_04100 [Candidatus Xenobia bacterium]|nr:hypothetical protein [Candidatus Xenobia bacterium]